MPIDTLVGYALFIGKGFWLTIQLLLGGMILAVVLATVVSIFRYNGWMLWFWNRIVSFLRGVPPILLLTFWFFSVPGFFGVRLSVLEAGIIAFGLQCFSYIAEILRAGIQVIPKGQFEAAKTLNISTFHMWKDIILPQVVRNTLPACVGECIGLLKETALIATIGGLDLMRYTQLLASRHFTYFGPICVAACYYYSLILVIEYFMRRLERKQKLYA